MLQQTKGVPMHSSLTHDASDSASRFSLRDGASFAEQARNVTFGLVGDEGVAERKRRQLTWDKKKKKFVKGDGTGADNVKMVKTESGTKLPATYRSGRFDEWKATNRVQLPNIGDAEPQSRGRPNRGAGGRKFKHQKVVAAKPLDKLAKNYDRKLRHIRKREESGEQSADPARPSANGVDKVKGKGPKIGGRYGGKPLARVKTELKTTEQIRKGRNMLAKKRAKNARPSRKRGKR
jgi:ATP-dependent RNA helicase DDX54/DBP10